MQTTPSPVSTKHSAHPVLIIAAVAVVLFCGVGTAALLGWLPNSTAGGASPGSVQTQASLQGPSYPAAVQSAPLPNNSANSGLNNSANGAPLQLAAASQAGQPQQEPMRDTQPAPAVCNSCGVIESIREIQHRAQGSGVGAAGGAILGGLLGNQVGSGHGRQLATVAGAVGGAVAGNQIEGNMKSTHSWEIVVRLDNGKRRTLHQSTQPGWHNGDAVKIVNGQLHGV